jgi:hypothetical protein
VIAQDAPGGGDDALLSGRLAISDDCVELVVTPTITYTLVWGNLDTRWDPSDRAVLSQQDDGSVERLVSGQEIGAGGGEGIGPAAEWIQRPNAKCSPLLWGVSAAFVAADD